MTVMRSCAAAALLSMLRYASQAIHRAVPLNYVNAEIVTVVSCYTIVSMSVAFLCFISKTPAVGKVELLVREQDDGTDENMSHIVH